MTMPHFNHERACEGIICGIDEAGRGPLAGDVYAAAVILDATQLPEGINDSKKLSKAKRDLIAQNIKETAQFGIGIATVEEIDEINILHATMLAMKRAYEALPVRADYALIDGNRKPELPCSMQPIVKGDTISLSIAAASIIAKTERDKAMLALHETYPEYHFHRNAGYGTKLHLEALREYGATPHHRRSFRPVREAIERIAA